MERTERRGERAFRIVTAAVAGLCAVCLVPAIFERFFAVAELLPQDRPSVWFIALGLGLISVASVLPARLVPSAVLQGLFGVVLLVVIELGARLVVGAAEPEVAERLATLAKLTRPELYEVQGHPFVNYSGIPGPYNDFGYAGDPFEYDKPEGVIRIAALGGSTTESGWIWKTGEVLDAQGEQRFEAMNFGLFGYTSAHNVVNFVLNIVDFSPDYAVWHSGWNDHIARSPLTPHRSDYSNVLRSFEVPQYPDRHLVRASVIYRQLRWLKTEPPNWIPHPAQGREEAPEVVFGDLVSLATYRRNVETFVLVALDRGIVPVLATQPYSQNPETRNDPRGSWLHITQTNDVMRSIAAKDPENVLLVDLDREMTGKAEHTFNDTAHLLPEGIELKGRLVAEAISAHIQRPPAHAPTEGEAESLPESEVPSE
jgi:hypothetical protein